MELILLSRRTSIGSLVLGIIWRNYFLAMRRLHLEIYNDLQQGFHIYKLRQIFKNEQMFMNNFFGCLAIDFQFVKIIPPGYNLENTNTALPQYMKIK